MLTVAAVLVCVIWRSGNLQYESRAKIKNVGVSIGEMSCSAVSFECRMTPCHCDSISLLMRHENAFPGWGLSWQIMKCHLLKHLVLAVTNSKKMSTATIDEKHLALSHTGILNLLLTPYPTGQPSSRKKAVNVKGICEGHNSARTLWTPCLPLPLQPAPKQAVWIQGHMCVISWSASLSFCLQRMKLWIWKRWQTRISELFKRYKHLLHW